MDFKRMHRFISKTLLFLIPFGSSLSALPLGNPMDPSLYTQGWVDCSNWFFSDSNPFSARLGYYADHVFNRKLEVERPGHPDVHRSILNTNAAYLALNWCDRIELFTALGASKICIDTHSSAYITFIRLPQDKNIEFQIETDTGFSWTLGARCTLFSFRNFCFGLEGAYFSTHPSLDFIKQENYDIVYTSGEKAKFYEWQVGAGVAYPICFSETCYAFIPYAGIKGGKAHLDMHHATFTIPIGESRFTLFDTESKLVIGFPIGVTFTLNNTIGVTVEGRFGDEQAIYVNGQFRF